MAAAFGCGELKYFVCRGDKKGVPKEGQNIGFLYEISGSHPFVGEGAPPRMSSEKMSLTISSLTSHTG